MRKDPFLFLAFLFVFILPAILSAKELPKIAVWDLTPLNINRDDARALTSILASEVLRGNSWKDDPGSGRAANRSWEEPAHRSDDGGFRLAFSAR